jgi:transaldolase
MKYFLDTGDFNDIHLWKNRAICIEGVTTNPILLNYKEKDILDKFISVALLFTNKVFVQIKQNNDLIVEEKLKDRIVFKVPAYPYFYDAMESLLKEGYLVSATTVYDMVQLNQAVEIGCQYSMVYLAKNENPNFLEEAVQRFGGSNTKLIAASFRTKNDVVRAIKSGIWGATIPAKVLDLAFKNELVERDLELLNESSSNHTS